MNEGLASCGRTHTYSHYAKGCRCEGCKAAAVIYRKRYYGGGVVSKRIPVGNIPDKVEYLLSHGIKRSTIGKVCMLSPSVVCDRKPTDEVTLESAKKFVIAWPKLVKLSEAAIEAGIEV